MQSGMPGLFEQWYTYIIILLVENLVLPLDEKIGVYAA